MFDWIKKTGLPHPENFPGGLGNLKDEAERQVKAVVQGILSRMDLVSRDELDVQLNVLMRTREKLEALETRLAALEVQLQNKKTESNVDAVVTDQNHSASVSSAQ
ncbi:MAG: accessory factor UbiK family protein [Pseudomonadota bacterium]